MAIDPSKLLPSSSSSSGSLAKINSKSFSIVKYKKPDKNLINSNKDPEENKLEIILKKVITIETILKTNLDYKKKKEEDNRKKDESSKRSKREEKLEDKDKDKEKKQKGIPGLPKFGGIFGGILERIKRFIFFVVLGKLFKFAIDFLPKLKGLLSIIGGVYQFTEKLIGGFLDGLIGFVDFGYKTYDKVRGIAKSIGGEKALKTLDSFTSNLEKFLNLALIAGMIYASESGGPGSKTPKSKPPKGRPVITQSGGGRAGRPDIRNPLRDRPTITTSGGRQQGSLGRNPLRTGPTITTSGGRPVGGLKVPKGAGALSKGARGIIGVGTILDLGFRLASGQPVSKAVVGAAGGAAGAAIGSWVGGAIGGVAGSVVPVLGNILLGGAGAAIGGILGGMLGGWISDSLYNAVTGYKEGVGFQKHKTGGRVKRTPRSRPSPIRRRPANKLKVPKKITPQKTEPGKSIGGNKKKIIELYSKEVDETKTIRTPRAGWDIFGLFTGGITKTQGKKWDTRGYNTLVSASKTFKEIPAIGEIMGAAIDVALGQELSEKVYDNLVNMISFISDMRTRQEYGNKMQSIISRFQEGGYVPDMQGKIGPSDVFFGKNLKSSLKTEIKKKVDRVIDNIKNSLDITGAGGGRPGGGGGGGDRPGGGGGDDTPGARLRDGSNAQIEADLLEYFTAIYGKDAAIGIVANLRRESGYRTKTGDRRGDAKGFQGMAQWDIKDRWPRFVKWAEKKGLDPYDRNAQAEYITVELRELGTDKRLKKAKTPEEAARIFYVEFERGVDTNRYSGSETEIKHNDFIRDIVKNNPRIGERPDDVVVRPTANIQVGQSKVSQDISDFRKFRSKLGGTSSRKPTANPEYYQIREMGVYGSGNYQINPLSDDTNYEINVHRGAGHWENRAFDIPVPRNSKEGDAVAEYWRSKGYTVLWRTSGHYDHVHVEVPRSKAQEWFKIVKNAKPATPRARPSGRPQTRPGTQPRVQGNWLSNLFRGNNTPLPREGIKTYRGQTYYRQGDRYYEVPGPGKPPVEIPKKIYDMVPITTGDMQGGGLIAPSKSNLPIPNSYTSYNDPRSSQRIFIQPIIIAKTSSTNFPSSSSSQHHFDSEIALNTNRISQYRS
jgi:hypothetical protein